jgi:hypothetical protein
MFIVVNHPQFEHPNIKIIINISPYTEPHKVSNLGEFITFLYKENEGLKA